VLKALANPARIFFVPYNLAVLNFVVLLMAYLAVFWGGLIVSGGKFAFEPLYFLLTLIGTHSLLALWSKKDPFLAKILSAKLVIWSRKIPKKLNI
jgi:type IV secretory pathway VirB3-like protein